jgi:hypothetical protein
MTDEERQKLCEWLHNASRGWSGSSLIEPKMAVAADEIERLQKEQAMQGLNVEIVKSMIKRAADEIERLQSIVQGYEQREPVAWRWRWHSDPPNEWNFADNEFHSELMTIEPLYTARPQPSSGEQDTK